MGSHGFGHCCCGFGRRRFGLHYCRFAHPGHVFGQLSVCHHARGYALRCHQLLADLADEWFWNVDAPSLLVVSMISQLLLNCICSWKEIWLSSACLESNKKFKNIPHGWYLQSVIFWCSMFWYLAWMLEPRTSSLCSYRVICLASALLLQKLRLCWNSKDDCGAVPYRNLSLDAVFLLVNKFVFNGSVAVI